MRRELLRRERERTTTSKNFRARNFGQPVMMEHDRTRWSPTVNRVDSLFLFVSLSGSFVLNRFYYRILEKKKLCTATLPKFPRRIITIQNLQRPTNLSSIIVHSFRPSRIMYTFVKRDFHRHKETKKKRK
jgi:hypothetical protein